MARQKVPLEVKTLNGGLVTELSPLNSPVSITLDERNMDLNRDGSRSRRLGFDYELSHTIQDSGEIFQADEVLGTSEFKWQNAGGAPDKELLVIQIGNHLAVYDLDNKPISATVVYSKTFSGVYSNIFSYAVVDGLLVVATGLSDVYIYEYNSGIITESTDRLLIRDLFGVEAFEGSTVLTQAQEIQTRPTSLEDTHTYNLRNQTYAVPRYNANVETLVDTIDAFFAEDSTYPSNSDNLLRALHADANDTDNRTIERFFPENLINSPTGSGPSPKGHFVIDVFTRGASRISQEAALQLRYPELTQTITTLPTDSTPGGIGVVEEYAGRIWYAGFSGDITGGDARSPRMSSYILFSKLVRDKTDIALCYQEADPTSEIESEIIDTDGGFLRIDGAYGINGLIQIGSSLFVTAANGVWRIVGNDENGFRATGYTVDRITDQGCQSPKSIVRVDDSFFYWGEQSIYTIFRDESGIWISKDLTQESIQTFYSDIDITEKKKVSGYFDGYERKIRWVYGADVGSATQSLELIFDVSKNAFTVTSINVYKNNFPHIVDVTEGQPYRTTSITYGVTVDGDPVKVSGVDIDLTLSLRLDSTKELVYLVIDNISGTIKYSFGSYITTDHYDWASKGSVDTEAYMITGGITGGSAQLKKQVPYLTTYFNKTEAGFSPSLVPTNQSSCSVQSRWDWTNLPTAGRWSSSFQAYRHARLYLPVDDSDTFNDGNSMVITRNKIRGRGRSIAFKFSSSPGKSMHMYGWSFALLASQDV